MSCSWNTVCEDTQVVCRQLGDRSERWLNIIISVGIINVHTVLITWKLLNSSLPHWPTSYVSECFSVEHRIELSVNNETFSAQLMGLIPATSYNCCISAVYIYDYTYTHKGACTEEYVTVQPSSDEISSNADTVGGVLGAIIIILVILLAILCGIILSYAYYLRRQGSVIVIPVER